MKTRLGIIADDLSGAADSGLQFARLGRRTVVLFALDGDPPDADVLVVDADSRARDATQAAIAVRAAAVGLRERGCVRLYKKIDSTLRGNLGTELDAILDLLPESVALVAPAFPAAGRTTVGGRVLVRGLPLEGTEFARDPLWPATDSRVASAIGRQSDREVARIGLDVIRAGVTAVGVRLAETAARGTPILVADAETADDLDVLGAAIAADERLIGVGSAGLAGALATALGWEAAAAAADARPAAATSELPVLAVVGSLNPVAREQLAVLQAAEECALVALDVAVAGTGGDCAEVAARRAGDEVARSLEAGRSVALALVASDARPLDPSAAAATPHLLAALGTAARRGLAAGPNLAGLILTGGDTAKAVCLALGATGLIVEREVAPGIPQGRLLSGALAGAPVVTKAGGFGGRAAFVDAAQVLRRVGTWRDH